MISFIVPISKRKIDRIDALLFNISKFYRNDEHEVIIAELSDSEGFKLGQIRNLGFKKSSGDIVVFIDVDIRLKDKVDFKEELELHNVPVVCWRNIIKAVEFKVGDIEEISYPQEGRGLAGCFAQYREQFIKANGFSNLLIGWGKEDDILFATNLPTFWLQSC